MVAQVEEEGQFPQAASAFDSGVLTPAVTRLSESKGNRWVREVERARHILGANPWHRSAEGATE
jgi:hypothetical protein